MKTKALKARTIHELCAKLDDAWYDAVEGCYTDVPMWGPETEAVKSLIGRSCGSGDVVSWDTRQDDQQKHLYLLRCWNMARQSFQPEHYFAVRTHAELIKLGYDL